MSQDGGQHQPPPTYPPADGSQGGVPGGQPGPSGNIDDLEARLQALKKF